MTELTITPMSLGDIAKIKAQMDDLHAKIKAAEEAAGIPAMREALSDISDEYEKQLTIAYSADITSQDGYQIINDSRIMQVIDPKKALKVIPEEIFWQCVKVTKTTLLQRLAWMYEEQGNSRSSAKKIAELDIEPISTKSPSGLKLRLVNLITGE